MPLRLALVQFDGEGKPLIMVLRNKKTRKEFEKTLDKEDKLMGFKVVKGQFANAMDALCSMSQEDGTSFVEQFEDLLDRVYGMGQTGT